MRMTRREAIRLLGLGAGAGALSSMAAPRAARAQAGRVLDVPIVGFALGSHIPSIVALKDILPTFPGYAPAKTTRFASQRVITQTIVSGSGDIGGGDPIITIRAVEAGADVKIIGLVFNNTSLVFVANGNKIKSLQDLQKPGTVVAVNSKGDFTHVLLVGPLLKQGIDLSKVTVIEIGGSGARTRALL
ncbi:MAG TPA: ABC transporter substrate-binding protein, partial [Candidatus Sulfotelmatobacter sp.]|nr:ABC transporter substrate-binding protein [Candidatus Sulfotelmatobacter sp.]